MTLKCTMILGDCLEVMPTLPQASTQMCFADLPYGMTDAKSWDVPVQLPLLWKNLHWALRRNGATLMSCIGRFMHHIASTNTKHYRYDLIFHKESFGGHLNANKMPLRTHENILVFYDKLPTYNPQKTKRTKLRKNDETPGAGSSLYGSKNPIKNGKTVWRENGYRHPGSVLYVPREWGARIHPTQKPVALLDWLIRSYSNPGDTALDPTSGSGTTAHAAIMSGRNVVCIEKDPGYFDTSVERIRKVVAENNLDVAIEVRR